mgnify:FL=1
MYSDSIIVGDDDSITLLGAETQSEVRSIIKDIVDIIICNDDKMESLLTNLTKEISQFQKIENSKSDTILSYFKIKNRKVVKNYKEIIAYMDTVNQELQMQQVKILKNIKMLELMYNKLDKYSLEIEESILKGEGVLQEGKNIKGEYDNWYGRLERKIYNLKITRTLSMQSKLQIYTMCENSKKMLDKVTFTISNTIPLWRMQVALVLGIKNNERNIISQEKIEKKIKKNTEYNHLNQIDKKDNGIDYAKLKDVNVKINSELYNLKRIEEEEKNIKNNLLNLIKSSGGNYGEI